MKKCDDTKLIALIKNSNPKAFNELYQRFWDELFTLAYKKIGDEDETYDVLQEMFIELWDKRSELNFNNSTASWLRNRLWFKIYGYFRTKGFNKKHQENFRVFALQENSEVQIDHLVELHAKEDYFEEILTVVNHCIEEMPDRMKLIFKMNRSGDYSISEIARELKISPNTVKKQLERATTKLKKATTYHDPTAIEFIFILWVLT
ncbi:MAG: RNA polymerase sigma factor [Sphingobacterium sp.]